MTINLIDIGNISMLVERGVGIEHANVIASQWREKCAENTRLRDAMQHACDLLAERKRGHSARSPGHNARLHLQGALSALTAGETTAQRGDDA